MNILYLGCYDQPFGQSPRSFDYAEYLAEAGHRVIFLSNSYDNYNLNNVSIPFLKLWCEDPQTKNLLGKYIRLKTPKYSNSFGRLINMFINGICILVFGIFCFFKNQKFDVIIGPSVPTFTSFSGVLLSKIFSCCFCFEIRDIWPDALVDIGVITKKNIIYILLKFMEKYIYNNADAIFSTLPFAKKHIDENSSKKIPFYYLPNGVKINSKINFSYNKIELKKIFSFVYIGGFGIDHDINSMLMAAKLLEEWGYKFKFDLYGSGINYQKYKNILDQISSESIEIHGLVPKKEVISILKKYHCSIAAITNSPSYRFGINLNKLTSYMTAGRPIIFSSSAPNNPIKESSCGFSCESENIYELAKLMERIINLSFEERYNLGLNGFNYLINNLSISKLGNKMEKSIYELI